MVELTAIARMVLEDRYLLKNEKGEVIESVEGMITRVSTSVCEADMKRMSAGEFSSCKQEIHDMMANMEFLPNSPTLMNAGTAMGQLSACFVLPVHDSIEGIFDAVKNMAQIHKSGGGTGFSFSRLRPKNDVVRSTKGVSSGPISLWQFLTRQPRRSNRVADAGAPIWRS